MRKCSTGPLKLTFCAFRFVDVAALMQALALLLAGAIGPVRFVIYCIAQILGAIAASAVLLGLLPGPLNVLCERSNGTGVAQALFFGEFDKNTKPFTVFTLVG